MSRTVKLALYVVCVIGVIVFGVLTVRSYNQATRASEQRSDRVGRLGVEPTNAVATATNLTEDTNAAGAAAATNAAATNVTEAVTNTAVAPAHSGREGEAGDAPEVSGVAPRSYTRMVTYGLGLLLFFLGLAALIGYDIAHFLGTRAQEALFNEDAQPTDPEYEKAEQMWANGQYLEAVRAMREYLEKNPREQYVALRIAEIYEQNLNNPLAAALEYEEVLKKKLPAERWGWAAIHLANIYSGKLNQPEKSIQLLRRIDAEFGQTAAAKKARERLLQVDPNFVPTPEPAGEPEEIAPSAPPAPSSNLPPGFRPKA